MNKSHSEAPLFHLFWENSTLNPSRSRVLRERIATDATLPYTPFRPSYARGAVALPASNSVTAPLWQARQSTRVFSSKALDLQSVANLLAPFAARGDGSRLLPSGGGKQPVLIYAALLNVEGALKGSIVWYDPQAHGLVQIGACPPWAALSQVLGTDWEGAPALVVFAIAHGQGMLDKYGERGGRFVLLEGGAAMTALSLEAAQAQLAGVLLGSFDDEKTLALLGLTSPEHLPLIVYACGKKI